MKRLKNLGFMMSLCLSVPVFAQNNADSTGLPGDGLDLQAVMDVFKTSTSPEDFEKRLNSKETRVNNLDINRDNKIDYIKVIDKVDGKSHALVLQVPISKTENQDVAVIAIEQTADSTAVCQIIGDKMVYGEEKIVEPYDIDHERSNGPADEMSALAPRIVFVNVWGWPCVHYMYRPVYVVYYSPWYWSYYPTWWDPWYPMYYSAYYGYMQPYHYGYYHYTSYCYVPHARNVYYAHRVQSPMVQQHYAPQRQNYLAKHPMKEVETGAVNKPVVRAQPVEPRRTPATRSEQGSVETVKGKVPSSRQSAGSAPIQRNPQNVERQPVPVRTVPQSTRPELNQRPPVSRQQAPVMRQQAPVMRQQTPVMRQQAPVMRQQAPVMRGGGRPGR